MTVSTLASDGTSPLPARLHLAGSDGKPVRSANALPFWRDPVSSPDRAEFELSVGSYQLTIERGPEWEAVTQAVEIPENTATTNVSIRLKRIVNLPAEGWWAGETHKAGTFNPNSSGLKSRSARSFSASILAAHQLPQPVPAGFRGSGEAAVANLQAKARQDDSPIEPTGNGPPTCAARQMMRSNQ